MDPTGNFYNYRTALRGAAHRSQTANSNRERVGICTTSLLLLWTHAGIFSHLLANIFYIHLSVFLPQIVIPFFSLLIKDIYFLNEGCANRLPTGHVNFEVRLPPYSVIQYLTSLKTYTYVLFWILEICGASTTGWGVHDMETGRVSIWGGSGYSTLPPHCSNLQWGW